MSLTSRHLMIRASAGTGKTFQLTTRYLRLLVDGIPPDEILATTFTRKAAGEILERVMQRLADAAMSAEGAAKLADELGKPGLEAADFQEVLNDLAHELHRLQICTLDSFFGRLATSYTLELGLPPGWSIIDDMDDLLLRQQAVESIIRDGTTGDIQRLKNLLEKGDAGRKVTRLLRETIQEFYEVFQQSAAQAWRTLPQLQRLTNEQLAIAIDVLSNVELPKDKRFEKARDSDVAKLIDEDWEAFISGGLAARVVSRELEYYKKAFPAPVVAAYDPLVHHARAVIIGELAQRTEATHELLARFDGLYQRLKHEQRGVKFEDIPRRLRDALMSQGMRHVAYRLDREVSHLLLDEFQDTSPVQWHVLRPFAEQIDTAEQGTSFFCVGDVKQAIYGWRGGVAELFDELEQQFPQLEVEPLNESYRSSQPVIDMVNRIFIEMVRHPEMKEHEDSIRGWCDGFERHTTARTELPGYACVVSGAAPLADEETDKQAILRSVAERVAVISQETPWASVGVLLRKHDEIAEVMNRLRQLDVPACEVGGNRVTDAASVLLMMSLLQLADHPGDTVARFHVIHSPLSDLWTFHDHKDELTAIAVADEVRRSLIEEGYGPTLTRYAEVLVPHCTDRERLRLGQLIELAYRYDMEPSLRPGDFIDSVADAKFVDPAPERVQVMTFHAAKGLQFDVVVVPLIESNLTGKPPKFFVERPEPTASIETVCLYRNKEIHALLPDNMQQALRRSTDNTVRETLCRLYVALTRSVHALHVVIPPSAKNERKLSMKPADLVRAGLNLLTPIHPGTLLHQVGDPRWHRQVEHVTLRSRPEAVEAHDTPDAQLRVLLAPMPDGRMRGLGRAAPSQHQPSSRIKLSDLLAADNEHAFTWGSLIHLWFEQIEWLEAGVLSKARRATLAQQHGHSDRVVKLASPAFDDMLSEPQLISLLSRKHFSESHDQPWSDVSGASQWEPIVRREQPIAVVQHGELMTGFIDRLVLMHDGNQVMAAEVIDFKTDRLDPHDEPGIQSRVDYYRSQLLDYGAAVSQTYDLSPDRISLKLAFVQAGLVRAVSTTGS